MKNGFYAQESKRTRKETYGTMTKAWAAMMIVMLVLYFAVTVAGEEGESLELAKKICLGCLGFMLFTTLVRVLNSLRVKQRQKNYGNLIIHYKDVEKTAAGHTIDDEAAQGKILVNEYIDLQPKGERIVLTPSYLLLCEKKITAIPVNKIFWICAQVGYKGGPYIVRVKIFAENKMYHMVGVDIEHVQNMVDKIYRYIPNIFSNYDTFDLSYRLEEVFSKDYDQFLTFYEQHKM